jgi:hypothetical protein
MNVLGIDPGLSGAVVRLSWPDNVLEARRDFKTLKDVTTAVQEIGTGCDYVFLEQVGAMQGQGVCSMFSFGRSTGVAMGSVWCAGLEFLEVAPQRWQGYWAGQMGDIPYKDKDGRFSSVLVARHAFPRQAELFARVKDHGTGDAALIAGYGASQILAHGLVESSRKKDARTVGGLRALRA